MAKRNARHSSSEKSAVLRASRVEEPRPRESSKLLLSRIVEASLKPGIKREAIFKKGSPKRIYAYSVLPSDPSKILREDADGNKAIGRLANGKFRILHSHAL